MHLLVYHTNRSMPAPPPGASSSSTHVPPPDASSSSTHVPPTGASTSSTSAPRVMSYFTAGANAGVGRDANDPPLAWSYSVLAVLLSVYLKQCVNSVACVNNMVHVLVLLVWTIWSMYLCTWSMYLCCLCEQWSMYLSLFCEQWSMYLLVFLSLFSEFDWNGSRQVDKMSRPILVIIVT